MADEGSGLQPQSGSALGEEAPHEKQPIVRQANDTAPMSRTNGKQRDHIGSPFGSSAYRGRVTIAKERWL